MRDDSVDYALMQDAILAARWERASELWQRLPNPTWQPDALQGLAIADGLRRVGKSEQSYHLYRLIFQRFEHESGANVYAARAVHQLEKKLKIKPTILPKHARPHKSKIQFAILVAATFTAAVALDFLGGQFQTLHIRNPHRVAATVQINGEQVHLKPGEMTEIFLAEGAYIARTKLGDGQVLRVAVDTHNDYLDHRDFILSVLGGEVFVQTTAQYCRDKAKGADPVKVLIGGQPFLALPHVDYLFSELPESTTIDADCESRTSLMPSQAAAVPLLQTALWHPAEVSRVDVLAYAQGQLRGGNRDPLFLTYYRKIHARAHQSAVGDALLAALAPLDAPATP